MVLLFIVSLGTVISIVQYLILEEGRQTVTNVLVISGVYGVILLPYILLITLGGMSAGIRRITRPDNDARPEAEKEA